MEFSEWMASYLTVNGNPHFLSHARSSDFSVRILMVANFPGVALDG
jgi:hypothetical protein